MGAFINSITTHGLRYLPRATNFIADRVVGRAMTNRYVERFLLRRPYDLYASRSVAANSLEAQGIEFLSDNDPACSDYENLNIEYKTVSQWVRTLESRTAKKQERLETAQQIIEKAKGVSNYFLKQGLLSQRLLKALLTIDHRGEFLLLAAKGQLDGIRHLGLADVLMRYLCEAAVQDEFPISFGKSIHRYFFSDSGFIKYSETKSIDELDFSHNRKLLYFVFSGSGAPWIFAKNTGGYLSRQELLACAFMLMKVELELQRPIGDKERLPLARQAATRASQFAIDHDLKVNLGQHMLSLLGVNNRNSQTDEAWLAALRHWIPIYFVIKSIFGKESGGYPCLISGRYFDTEVDSIIEAIDLKRKAAIQAEFGQIGQLGKAAYFKLERWFISNQITFPN